LAAGFRQGSTKNFILITDEDDDSLAAYFSDADQGLTDANAIFNFIGVPDTGNTNSRYGILAANHGGAAFNILDFRADPEDFFANFINTKVEEIKDSASPVPEPMTMLLLGIGLAGLAARSKK
jgi:hypothetical protein